MNELRVNAVNNGKLLSKRCPYVIGGIIYFLVASFTDTPIWYCEDIDVAVDIVRLGKNDTIQILDDSLYTIEEIENTFNVKYNR